MKEPIRIVLPTIFESMSVNAWLFNSNEPTLVDCGEKTDQSWEALQAGLAKEGLKISDLKKVIITHGHLDHMGMANKIVENSDAKIYVSEYLYDWAVDLQTMLDRRSDAIQERVQPLLSQKDRKDYFKFGAMDLLPMWEEIPTDRIVVFPMEGSIDIGGAEWEIIYTPGHCINQTCFYHGETGYFLSADMLLKMIPIPIIDAGIKPPYLPVKSLMLQLESYQKIAALNITKTFPGHFEAFEKTGKVISRQLAKIQKHLATCLSLLEDGPKTVMQLTELIYPGRINDATLFMVVGFIDILLDKGQIKSYSSEQELTFGLD